jgi:regulatory protein
MHILKKMGLENKNIGTEAAFSKLKYYCAYQERNHNEVKKKLYGYGLYKTEVEEIISKLIEENYLNEERYAIAYAGGKFRVNKWGKTKILYELKQKQISAYCIKKAMAFIHDEDYEKCLKKLAVDKLELLKKEQNVFTKKSKLQNYLMGKGYEFDWIKRVINELEF